MFTRWMIVLSLNFLFVGPTAARAGEPKQPPKETVDKGQAALKEHLEKIKGAYGQVLRLDAAPLNQLFPEDVFFAVRYRIYPVARKLPEGMKPSNVFVYDNGKLTHLADVDRLDKFFKERLPAVKDEATAKKAAQAWLWLSQEFAQDGFYKFVVSGDDATRVADADGQKKVKAKATVMAGGNGEMDLELSFSGEGKLTAFNFQSKVRPGPRPICQATKLLDADPIVRRMAEQDLLYMGLAARDYIMEQRALAGPELRRAIDRLWHRIEKEGW
jgi:hypothetical protein